MRRACTSAPDRTLALQDVEDGAHNEIFDPVGDLIVVLLRDREHGGVNHRRWMRFALHAGLAVLLAQ